MSSNRRGNVFWGHGYDNILWTEEPNRNRRVKFLIWVHFQKDQKLDEWAELRSEKLWRWLKTIGTSLNYMCLISKSFRVVPGFWWWNLRGRFLLKSVFMDLLTFPKRFLVITCNTMLVFWGAYHFIDIVLLYIYQSKRFYEALYIVYIGTFLWFKFDCINQRSRGKNHRWLQ